MNRICCITFMTLFLPGCVTVPAPQASTQVAQSNVSAGEALKNHLPIHQTVEHAVGSVSGIVQSVLQSAIDLVTIPTAIRSNLRQEQVTNQQLILELRARLNEIENEN